MSSAIDLLMTINDKIDSLVSDVNDIKVHHAELPCKTHHFRLKILERITYGFIALVLIGFFATVTGNNTKKAKVKYNKAPSEYVLREK